MKNVPKRSRSLKEEGRYQELLDQVADPISIHDQDFNILFANRAFAAYVGRPREEILNEKCYAVIHGCNLPVAKCPHRQTLSKHQTTREEVHDPKSGKTFQVSTFPHHAQTGEFLGSVHLIRDLTAQREKELGSIVREVRMALAGGGGTDLPEERASIGIRIHGLLDGIVALLDAEGRLRHVKVDRRYCPADPMVVGDKGEIRHVLSAVLTNALEAMDGAGSLTLATGLGDGTVQIEVADSGPGIAPEDIDCIFKPFFTSKGGRGGTGLGLAIARALVTRHRGEIAVLASRQGEGTTFGISFPVANGTRS